MKIIILLHFCFVIFNVTFGQNSKTKIISAIDRNGYSVIPNDVIEDSTINGITVPLIIGKSSEIHIQWHSVCTDGSYILVITPEQIYLHSSHDNPNPNILYWEDSIDFETYSFIKKGFLKNKWGESFFDKKYTDEYLLPNEWNNENSNQFDKRCDSLFNSQVGKMVGILNSFISKNKIEISSSIYPERIIYIGNNEQEIIDWMPILIESKKQ